MTRATLVFSLLIAASLAGCDEPTAPTSAPVTMRVTSPAAVGRIVDSAGIRVRLHVTAVVVNNSEYEVDLLECSAQLFRDKREWELVAQQACFAPGERHTLAPGDSVEAEFEVFGCAVGVCTSPYWVGPFDGRYILGTSVNVAIPGTVDGMLAPVFSRRFIVSDPAA